MKYVALVTTLVLLVVAAGLTVGCYAKSIAVYNDVNPWLTRAQVAADIEDMQLYLDKAEQGLDKRGMDSGHSGLVVKNSENDFALIRQNIDRIQERAQQLAQTPKAERGSDPAYQTGLDDLRGTLRELSVPAEGYYWRHDGLGYAIFVWVIWCLSGLAAVWAYFAFTFSY